MIYPESRCKPLNPKYSKVFLQLLSLYFVFAYVCTGPAIADLQGLIQATVCYILPYITISPWRGPSAFKSAAGCLIVEDSLLGPLNCSPGTMDSFVNVFLFLSLDNTRGSFWLSALKKCLQNYTSLYASQNKQQCQYKSVGGLGGKCTGDSSLLCLTNFR